MLEGLARKVGLVLAGVTVLPWLLFVIGFGLLSPALLPAAVGSVFFPHFIITLLGIPTIALGVVHALGIVSGSVAKIISTVTTFFSVLFLLCLGMILYLNGNILIFIDSMVRNTTIQEHPVNLEFFGALLATLSWTGMMMIWNFYVVPEAPAAIN